MLTAKHLFRPVAALGAMLCLGGCLHGPGSQAPYHRIGVAAEIGARLNNYSEATLPADGVIVVRGDGFVPKAEDPDPKHRRAEVASLSEALAKATGLPATDQTAPGETVAQAEARLQGASTGNLVVIAYGYGDAAAGTPVKDFKAALMRMIRAAHDRNAAVYLLVEPATTLPRSKAVEPYRNAVLQIAAPEGAGVIDALPALAAAGLGPSKTRTQSARAVALMAGQIAQYVRVSPRS